ncbi:SdrD B-like domain-containing protein [Clostridium botulinum]|uniref:SdrD B-like domain-containing protein n=1 Tax=Clostridium botulinum TaxID=1491 RepID=UPI003DA59865
MATISGRVVFDRDRSATINAGDSGIANVPVVLQNTASGLKLVVLTDANGNYSFINVPNGNYRIVQSFGTPGGVPTPGNFNNAVVGPVPVGTNPPISFVTNPPPGSTNLDSLTPDTLLVTVTGEDLTNENFLDGPVIYTPIQNILDPCVSVSNVNLINVADNGTFGFFPPGTPANTGAPVEPYPGVTPDFTYVLPDPTKFTPLDGEYTVQNIMTNAMSNQIGAWWRIADHTTGNETGRMMVVNGFNPGAVFFRDVVSVQPNTNYLFSSWILNLFKVTGFPNPELGVRILGSNGDVLYSATLGAQIPVNTNAPEWKQIGTVINSQNNTSLTVEFLSEGPAVIGNDYAIDDVSLNEIQIPLFIPVKTVSTPVANVGETVTYTVTLENTCTSPLTNVFFKDNVPNGLSFVPGSVTVNGVSDVTLDPNIGFTIPDILGGSTATVTFEAIVNTVPTPNPTLNTATINYSYTPVEGGIENNFTVNSNTVPLEVGALADVSVVKTGSPDPVIPGEVLTYTIDVMNAGPSDAQNVVLDDEIPSTIIDPEFSIDGGVTFNPWPTIYDIGTLLAGEIRTILIRGTVASSATGIISNIANVISSTPDPNLNNNTSIVNTEINALADISVVKTASPNPVNQGEILTYTIDVTNAGPADAQNVVLTDDIPPEIIGAEFSIDGGVTFSPWTGSLDLGALLNGETRTILIRGTVSPSAIGTIRNTAGVISSTPDPDLNNNMSTVDTEINTADISVIKTSDLNPAFPGEILTYTIRVSNAGPADAQNVVLTDAIPPEIVGPEFSVDGGVIFNPWPGSFNIGTLLNGETRTILIRGTVAASASGIISNTAEVTSTTPDPNPDNNTSTVDIEVNALADISVIKAGSPNPVMSGETLTYTIDVSNFGPSLAENVTLSDVIPPEITGAEFSTDGGVTFNPWTGSLALGTLLNGETRTILIRGTVAPVAPGFITNTADVTSTTPDPNPSNNTSTSVIEVNESTQVADVGVFKSVEMNPVTPGEMVVYPIRVSNFGPADAQNVILTDAIPPEITGAEFSTDGGVTFNPWPGSFDIGTLPAGETRNILIRGTVSPSATGIISNTAEVSSTTEDPNPSNNTSTVDVEVVPSADVSVTKTAAPNPVAPGEILTYTINVSNAGPSNAQNVVLTDAIPASIIGAEFSTDGGVTFDPWPGSFDIGTLLSGETRTILIRGTVSSSATGTITNTANIDSSTPDPNLDNNESTTITEVNALADISVIKTGSPNPIVTGEILTYTIVVSNAGPADAQNVILNDEISPNVIAPEFSIDGGVTFNPWPTIYVIGTLPVGETRTILIRGTVSPSATGVISNTASVISSTPDPNPDNNESTTMIEVNPAADIGVIKTSSPNPVMPGEILTYTIDVTNAGPADAQNVVLDDAISPDIIAPEFSIDGGVTFNPWPTIYIIGTLPAGETRTILIRGTVSPSATGVITNTAAVTSSTPDPNPNNNESTVNTEVSAGVSADVSVVKTAITKQVRPGDTVVYTIVVSNSGPSDAQNVVLTDTIPPEIISPEFSIDGGLTFNPWTGSLDIGTLPAGASRTIIITGKVVSSNTKCKCITNITNIARVTSTTPDPNLNNNTSIATIKICRCFIVCFKCRCCNKCKCDCKNED